MKNLVFLLEERSAKECLENVVRRLLEGRDDIVPYYIPFEGKCDLERNVEGKIRYWANPAETIFLVLRDQDAEDCRVLKNRLAEICNRTGKPNIWVRIACRELETFYLGDLEAVGKVFPACRESQQTRKFRNPDAIGAPADELKKITKDEYRKISGSREISQHLRLDGSNRSTSFNALVSVIKRIIGE